MIVAVIGDSTQSADTGKAAERVGELLAGHGAVVICGGLTGVMESVCRGAKSKGGLTIGILPGDTPEQANPWVDIPIATGVGYARNMAVVKSADAVIAVGGGYGTLTEIAYALKRGVPVVGLNTWSISRNGQEDTSIARAISPEDAVDKVIALSRQQNSPGGAPPPNQRHGRGS